MKLEAIGISEKGQFRIVNSAMFREGCNALPSGHYRVVVEKKRKNKSLPQLGYYYGCLLPLTHKALLEAGWEFADLAEVDSFWKDQFANREIVNRNTGEVMSIPALKRNFTTTDMMAFVESIRNYCSEYLGTYIPGPGEQLEL